MNILLTGSSGFLGSILLENLSDNNKIHTLNRTSGDIICDLSKEQPSFTNNYDCVIHSAGLAHVNNNSTAFESFYKNNVLATKNLLKSLEFNTKPKMFVLISSVSVYGLKKGILIDENSDLLANDYYGISKILTESLVLDWCERMLIKCTVLRLPLIVGKNPPGNLGQMLNAIKNGIYFNIASGKSKKSMVLAEDIAKYILTAANIGGIYNLTDTYHPSFYELSKCIAAKFNKKYVINVPYFIAKLTAILADTGFINIPLTSDKLEKICNTLTFDDTKAKRNLNWSPRSVLKFGF